LIILDRYIIFRYLGNLVWAITAATVIFLVVDLVENLDKFIDSRVPTVTILHYYYLFIPYIIYLILPVATLLATLFTIGGMTLTNELSAMQVSGVPFIRPLVLLILTAGLVAAAGFCLGEGIVPVTNRKRMDIYRYEVRKLPREARARHGKLYIQVEPGRELYIDRYNPSTREAYGIEIIDLSEGRLVRRVDAEKMVWLNSQWHLQSPVQRQFYPDGTVQWGSVRSMTISGAGLRPDEIEKVQTAPEEMNWNELRAFIQRLKRIGGSAVRWEVELFFKVSMPVAAVVIVLFGAPIAAVKRRGGTMLGFGLAMFICFVYFGFIQVGKVLGYNETLTPWVSAWIGNAFFGLLGLAILVRWVR